MTAPTAKYQVTPLLAQRFNALSWDNYTNFHIILEDPNFSDSMAACCMEGAVERGLDAEGIACAQLIVELSPTQRRKLARMVDWHRLSETTDGGRR